MSVKLEFVWLGRIEDKANSIEYSKFALEK